MVTESDISVAHRLDRKPANQVVDRRNIVVKFCRRDTKSELQYACRQERPSYYINESLTPLRSRILYIQRKMKRETAHQKIISGCRSIDGSVFVWTFRTGDTSGPNRRWPVNTRRQLEKCSEDNLGVLM